MLERIDGREISRLYLELASDCFKKAMSTDHAGTADIFRRMGMRYVAQATALKSALRRADRGDGL
jgi:hypothetical protein